MSQQTVSLGRRYTLSPTQRALYASQQRHPRSPLQNMVRLTHIAGPIDPDRLASAFAAVVASSDALRTRLSTAAGETVVSAGRRTRADRNHRTPPRRGLGLGDKSALRKCFR